MDIPYKLLRLLEDREQIITDRNTKTNYQITNSADQPLTVNASTFGLQSSVANFFQWKVAKASLQSR